MAEFLTNLLGRTVDLVLGAILVGSAGLATYLFFAVRRLKAIAPGVERSATLDPADLATLARALAERMNSPDRTNTDEPQEGA